MRGAPPADLKIVRCLGFECNKLPEYIKVEKIYATGNYVLDKKNNPPTIVLVYSLKDGCCTNVDCKQQLILTNCHETQHKLLNEVIEEKDTLFRPVWQKKLSVTYDAMKQVCDSAYELHLVDQKTSHVIADAYDKVEEMKRLIAEKKSSEEYIKNQAINDRLNPVLPKKDTQKKKANEIPGPSIKPMKRNAPRKIKPDSPPSISAKEREAQLIKELDEIRKRPPPSRSPSFHREHEDDPDYVEWSGEEDMDME